MKNKKNAFTLVELIVVITILAILATIGFIYFWWNVSKANKSKLITNLSNITKLIESKLASGDDVNDFMSGSLFTENAVNTGATIGSGAYVLWNLNYKVWNINFFKLKIKGNDWKNETSSWAQDYIFATLKYKNWTFYQVAAEVNWEAIIYWKYYNRANTDAKWLISEKWFDIWLQNWDSLTWSLY